MYTVSELFKTYIVQPDRTFETKALVGTTTYDNTKVVEFDTEDSVVPSEDFSIGNVIPSKLTITIKTTDSIATNAKITPSVRLYGASGWTEWVPLGSYYIDSRNHQNDVWKFVCYDKLILAQQLYVSALTYPIAMSSVMTEIAGQLGITLDSSVGINHTYEIPYKDEDITIRDMLSYIASAHGASVKMTKDEKLAFVEFAPGAAQTAILPSGYFKASQTNPLKTYTKILLTYNTDGETLTSGSGDDDHTLKIYNPFMDQAILDSVLAMINGFSYTPFTMDWKGRPDLEVGDGVIVTQRDGSTFSSTILTNKMSFKGGLKSTMTAPSYAAQRSEFDYKGSLSKQVANAVKLEKPYYGVTISRASGITIKRSDGFSEAHFNSDVIEIVKIVDGIPIKMFYVDIDGNLILAGAIIQDVLYVGLHGGALDTSYDAVAPLGSRASIRLKPGSSDAVNSGYIQAVEDGTVFFYKNDGTGVPFARINPDKTTDLIGPGGGGSQATDTAIVYPPADAGVVITKDGNAETWTWVKDGGGRITSMSSSLGRTFSVTY